MRAHILFFLCGGMLFIFACKKEAEETPQRAVYDGTPYQLEIYALPEPSIAEDNQLTVKGVELGKRLFYDKILSEDQSMACASCHQQQFAFSDTNQFSIGVQGLPGGRQSMAVVNMAWNSNAFFWDGRAHLLRDQVLMPIEDELELNLSLEELIQRLKQHPVYPDLFIEAFDAEIDAFHISLALEQFCNAIVSGNSKYDHYLAGTDTLNASEERGRQLFFAEFNPGFPDISGADCAHCHGGANFENDAFMNNALDSDAEMEDMGHALVSGEDSDNGKFKVPSLRNIALTPPYMHDGRFSSLEEVVEHYNSGMQMSSTIDPALIYPLNAGGLQLSDQDIVDLVAFLHTLSDESLLTNPEYANPF